MHHMQVLQGKARRGEAGGGGRSVDVARSVGEVAGVANTKRGRWPGRCRSGDASRPCAATTERDFHDNEHFRVRHFQKPFAHE